MRENTSGKFSYKGALHFAWVPSIRGTWCSRAAVADPRRKWRDIWYRVTWVRQRFEQGRDGHPPPLG